MIDLPSRYNSRETEDKWTRHWKERNVFHADPDPRRESFTIVIPPPNITGILHMGHAFNNTLQDILIRFRRMQGFSALWMPGTDHAGIATQNVVEKQLAKEGKDRQTIGREGMLERLWNWKKEYGDTIIRQLEKLGASCDWPRTRFTMDEHYSRCVRLVFVKLFEKGLIYRGQYIINWCPRCQTALSDEEAEHKETKGTLYYIRYPLKDNPGAFVTVATTRPETMLGDTAVAVNPADRRYAPLVGQTLVLPLLNRKIPVISDEFVDPQFGTGAVKVTPAHDPNDFEMGRRHDLPFINIMNPDAALNENAGPFAGQDRFAGRKAVLRALKEAGLLEKTEDHHHAVGHCYRCHTMVEPYLSRQWFVKMKPLAEPAIRAVREGEIVFHPERWTKVYLNWMENIRDWCISRQIWWGHRIPVWYCPQCPEEKGLITSVEDPSACPHCGSGDLRQDEDVLDTWFSSWLWPFATLHWPEATAEMKCFYPTSVLVTASEIIFFWVARMIMAGFEFTGQKPFRDVLIHGTVRDAKGLKMSKSLGNTIDPLEIINDYGADALRFSLIINSGQDLYISKEKFETGRNFANKIWNASRLIFLNINGQDIPAPEEMILDARRLDLPTRWILSRLQRCSHDITEALEKFRFSEAETLIYDFFWKNFCDWYLEVIKDRWEDKDIRKAVIVVLRQALLLLHPFMPYVTEELWHKLYPQSGSIALCRWPRPETGLVDEKAENDMQGVMDVTGAIRNLRSQWNIAAKADIDAFIDCPAEKETAVLRDNRTIIASMAKLKNLEIGKDLEKPAESATSLAGPIKVYVPLSRVIDIGTEKRRLSCQIDDQESLIRDLSARLKNKKFLEKAPADVVSKEKDRLQASEYQLSELKKVLEGLS